jgi:metal-dependent hydrolase (beta-lactamase superfamily II)
MHLRTASRERMDKTIAAFRGWDVQQLALGHCTGMPAINLLWTAFPDRCSACAVGVKMSF